MPWGYAAAAIGGSLISAGASKSASNTQSDAAKQAADESAREFNISRSDSAPFRQAGVASLGRLQELLGTSSGNTPQAVTSAYSGPLVATSDSGIPIPVQDLYENNPQYRQAWNDYLALHKERFGVGFRQDSDPGNIEGYIRSHLPDTAPEQSAPAPQSADFGSLIKPFSSDDLANDPVYQASYQSGLNMGRDAILKAAAARGGLGSPADVPGGGILKDLTQFATDYTATKGNEAFNRNMAQKQGIYGMLSGQQLSGLNATNAGTSAGIALTGQINDANTSGANARAAGIVGGANAWNTGLSQGYNLYNNDRIYSMLNNRNGGGSGGGGSTYYIDNTGYDSRY